MRTHQKIFRLNMPIGLAALLAITLVSALIFVGNAKADTPLLIDDFDYGSSAGDLTVVSGGNWSAHSGVTAVQYSTTSLSMAGYGSSGIGGSATINGSNTEDVNRTFPTQSSGVVYASALMEFTTATSTGNYFFHLRQSGGSFRARVFAKDSGGNLQFGISSGSGTGNYAPDNFSYNTTYLVVTAYDTVSGNTKLYVLDAYTNSEPATPLITSADSALGDIAAVALRQSTNIPSGTIDGVRVATTWSDVVGASAGSFSISKSAPALVGPGELFAYTLTVTNNTGITATNTVITDVVPTNADFASAADGGTETSGVVSWTVAGDLADGASIARTFVVTAASTSGVDIVNSDYGVNASNWVTTAVGSPITTTIAPLNLYIEKTGPAYGIADNPVTYMVAVHNEGVADAVNVVVTDTLPISATYDSSDMGTPANPSGGVYVWNLGTVPSNTMQTYYLTVTVDANVSPGTVITNSIAIATDTAGDDPANNSSMWQTTIYPLSPIADARAGNNGETFAVEGKVIYTPGTYNGNGWGLQDASGGIAVYYNSPPTIQLGDSVQLISTRGSFNGEEQLASELHFAHLGAGSEVAPMPFTTAQVVSGTTEGWLISLTGVVGGLDCPLSYNDSFTIDDGSGAAIVYIDGTTGVDVCGMGLNNGDAIEIIGFSTQYNSDYQIKPRRPADIVLPYPILQKQAPAMVEPGQLFTYTLTVENYLGYDLTNVVITDAVPVSSTFVLASDGGMIAGDVVSWTVATLPNGGIVERTFQVSATTTAGTLITNDQYAVHADNWITETMGAPVNTAVIISLPIYDIQYTTDSSGDSPYRNLSVRTEGVVTANFGDQVFIQDGSGAWNGVMLYRPNGTLNVGDYIEVTGMVIEYYGMTEFAQGAATTVISSSNPLPDFTMLPTGDVSDEPYESVLVQVNSVTVTDEDLGNGEWEVNDGSGAVRIDDYGSYTYVPAYGDDLFYVRGPLNYSFSAFKIEPRDDGDIVQALLLTKSAPTLVAPGSLFTYTIAVENRSGVELTNLVITDVVPADTTLAYTLDGGIENSGLVSWAIASLAHGATVEARFAVTATNSLTVVVNDDYAVLADDLDAVIGDPVTTYVDYQLHIYHVQGEEIVSPLVDEIVTVSGAVVADFQGDAGMRGFFMQDAVGDGNALTSDGIFVYDYGFNVDVNVGDLVTVTGNVVEYQNMTELNNITAIVTKAASINLTPVAISLPETTNGELEQYEGMVVSLAQTMTAAQNYFQGRYGQVTLAADGRVFQPTNVYAPSSPEAIALANENARRTIILDDAYTGSNPYPTPYIGLNGTMRAGDTTANLVGVLDEGRISSGSSPNLDYRLQPFGAVAFTRVNARTMTPNDVGGDLKVASFNVLNYFTTFGSRGADNQFEFDRQRAKIITAVVALDSDVVGLMEIENNATEAIGDLVDGLNEETAPGTYAYIDTGIIGGDEIKVAMIYQPASVTPVGITAVLDDVFPFDTNTRPPIAQAFMDNATGQTFIAVVNHFKSKGSPCDSLGDPDTGDGQGNCNLTRVEAANQLNIWLATDPTGTGDPDILIIGDLNSYAKEDPIAELESAGYTNLVSMYEGMWTYSYIFDGASGYLDHALASSSMASQVVSATTWHINTDEPSALDYNDYNSPELYQPHAYRASDHDPVMVGVRLYDITIVAPTNGQIFTATNNVSYTVPITIETTNFDIPTDGHWHLWVDGVQVGPIMDYATTTNLTVGTHVITAELRSPEHVVLGPVSAVTVTVVKWQDKEIYLPLIMRAEAAAPASQPSTTAVPPMDSLPMAGIMLTPMALIGAGLMRRKDS